MVASMSSATTPAASVALRVPTFKDSMVGLVHLVKNMREMGYEPFIGEHDAVISWRWIQKLKNTLNQIRVAEELRVDYVTQLLSDKAQTWWEIVQMMRTIEEISWDDFKMEFENKFYS